jgi:hypothetical protein
VKKKITSQERIETKLQVAKQKESAQDLKEVAKEMDQPRVAASAREEEPSGFVSTTAQTRLGPVQ